MRLPGRVLLLSASLLLLGCGVDYWRFVSQQTGPNPHTTLVLVWLADSPVDDAENLWVTLDRVEVVSDDGTTVISSRRTTYDLLSLRNGVRAEAGRGDVPSDGDVSAVRLVFAPETGGTQRIRIGGITRDLVFTHSGARVVEIPMYAALNPDGTTELHVDVDARTSVLEAGSTWLFEPQGSGVDPLHAGTLGGTVRGFAGLPLSGAVVSAQRGLGEVTSTRTDLEGRWSLGPLSTGSLTLVVTAAGHRTGSLGSVFVSDGMTLDGLDITLLAAVDGAVAGSAPAGTTWLRIRVYLGTDLVAMAGVDPLTGSFVLPRLASGTYRVELWSAAGLVDVNPAVVVPAGGSVSIGF